MDQHDLQSMHSHTSTKHRNRKLTNTYLDGRHNGKMRDYYRILDCLGAGAFGEVRKCVYREKSDNKSFYKQYRAVKIISKNHLDEKGIKSFQGEVEVMLKLNGRLKTSFEQQEIDKAI